MWWIILAVLILILISIFNFEPKLLTDIKERYRAILGAIKKSGDPTWDGCMRESIITGMVDWSKNSGPIGSNVNKGYEIYICLDGSDVNSAVYVLIHELAHMSVPEYDHTEKYWENFKKLKEFCVQNELYSPQGARMYCGDDIKD
jgi:hypothetical protein